MYYDFALAQLSGHDKHERYRSITLFVNGHAASKLHYAYPDLKQSTNTTVKFMYLEVVKRNIRLSV